MPMPPVEPTPWLPRESFRAAPLLAQDASYFAASARISSLRVTSMFLPGDSGFYVSEPFRAARFYAVL